MNIYLPGYSLGNRMAVVARSEEVFEELIHRNIDVMYIDDSRILFVPGNFEYADDGIYKERLALLCDYDIVEISDLGILYRSFANNEADTTIFLGASCNSNCIMCPASDIERKNGFSYGRDMLLKYIEYLPKELEYLVMTGGEPTMQKELFLEVLGRVKEKYPYSQVLLLTNGRSLSDRSFFDKVEESKPCHFRIAIPIHGSTSEKHDLITRVNGSFEQTMLALTRLMNSEIETEIRIVVTRINCDDLLNIAKLIESRFRNVNCIHFIGLEPRGNCALNFDSVYIDHHDSFLKSKEAIEYLISHGYDVGLYNYPLCAIDRDFWPIAEKSISAYKNVFHTDCEKCHVKEICGGFFTAAMSIAKPTVNPIMI